MELTLNLELSTNMKKVLTVKVLTGKAQSMLAALTKSILTCHQEEVATLIIHPTCLAVDLLGLRRDHQRPRFTGQPPMENWKTSLTG